MDVTMRRYRWSKASDPNWVDVYLGSVFLNQQYDVYRLTSERAKCEDTVFVVYNDETFHATTLARIIDMRAELVCPWHVAAVLAVTLEGQPFDQVVRLRLLPPES
jgi:hypothetical protein